MTAQKPGDWAEYKWLVPVYEGSQLHKPSYRQLVEWDLDHPHIGIYCDCKQSSPWLLGEFAVVPGDELAWVWSYGWVTGDGYWVALKSALTKGPDIWMDMDELLRLAEIVEAPAGRVEVVEPPTDIDENVGLHRRPHAMAGARAIDHAKR